MTSNAAKINARNEYAKQLGLDLFQVGANVCDAFDSGYEYGLSADRMSHTLIAEPGYEKLVDVLRDAHNHAAYGKGKQRHANDLPFEQQRMLSIARLLKSPPDALAFQVCKKVAEGLQMEQHERKVAELLGAINYIAGIVILLGEEPVPAGTDFCAEPVPDQTDSHNPQDPYSKLAADFEGVKFESPTLSTEKVDGNQTVSLQIAEGHIIDDNFADELTMQINRHRASRQPHNLAKTIGDADDRMAMTMINSIGVTSRDYHLGELHGRIQRALADLRKNQPIGIV